MKVQVGHEYIFYPNLLDRIDNHMRIQVTPGTIVRVINLHGAPKANTMGHCYIADRISGAFISMVSTNSLYRLSEAQLVIDAIKKDIAAQEARA